MARKFQLTATKYESFIVEEFDPDVHPWPRGVYQISDESGTISNMYYIGYDIVKSAPISKGDLIAYDELGNVRRLFVRGSSELADYRIDSIN